MAFSLNLRLAPQERIHAWFRNMAGKVQALGEGSSDVLVIGHGVLAAF